MLSPGRWWVLEGGRFERSCGPLERIRGKDGENVLAGTSVSPFTLPRSFKVLSPWGSRLVSFSTLVLNITSVIWPFGLPLFGIDNACIVVAQMLGRIRFSTHMILVCVYAY